MPAQPHALPIKSLFTRLRELPAWRQLVASRSARDGEGLEAPRATHVFSGNSVVDRVLHRLLNKAERELVELQQLPETLRRQARRARGAAKSRTIGVETTPLEQALRPLLLPLLGGAARLFMRVCNTTTVQGEERLANAVLHRVPGQGLLSVCNHVGALDDPLVLAAALPAQVLTQPEAMRWTMCAADRCFLNPLADAFFRAGKVLPLTRGLGLQQPGMAAAEKQLATGQWVHIFPEGTRSQTGAMGPVRVGVGRLYAAALAEARRASPAAPAPLLLPFVHAGMADVNPRGTAKLGVGKDVRVLVGEPLDLSLLVAAHDKRGDAPEVLYAALAARVEEALRSLHTQLLTGELPPAPAPAETLVRRAHLAVGHVQELAARSRTPRELGHLPFAGFAASAVGAPGCGAGAGLIPMQDAFTDERACCW